jgi:hypothetical protein
MIKNRDLSCTKRTLIKAPSFESPCIRTKIS